MTLIRELEPVKIRSYKTGVDEYGAIRQLGHTDRTVEMVVKIYHQANVQDPRYIDVTLTGITKDKDITDANTVIYKDKEYNIKYIIPSPKYLTLLLGNNG